jgi:hypothetical protein
VSDSQKPNSWSRGAAPHAKLDTRAEGDRTLQVDWSLAPLSGAAGAVLFEPALANPLRRFLTFLAKRRSFVLVCGLLLISASAYCLAAPSGSTLVGLPVEYCSIALAVAAILLALLVTLGAWLRPLESVQDAVEVLGVPLIAFEKEGTPDVR